MSPYWVLLFLGVLQGLTEFLPVSSSAHLAVFQHILGFKGDRIFFDVLLHFSTLLAVLVYFRKEIVRVFTDKRLLLMVVVASVPTGAIGLLLKDFVERLLYFPRLVALFLLITAFLVWMCDRLKGSQSLNDVGLKVPFIAGIFQGLAVIPGISRSGSTVFALLLCGLKREEAASFSFVISIPAVLGATFLELLKAPIAFKSTYIAPMVLAFLSGLLAIHLFVDFLKKRSFFVFSLYLVLFSLFVLVFG